MPKMIAVDWGTTRMRAYLLGQNDTILAQIVRADGGMQGVAAGQFPAVLASVIAPWLAEHPHLPVIMAGMVGARNGWVEAAYAKTPASAADVAAQMLAVTRQDGGTAMIVPGVSHKDAAGCDVMRGEETLIFGCAGDGLVVLPGTHSKWAQVLDGKITGFATYMTGELFAFVRGSSILSRLAEEPEDEAGFSLGLAAAQARDGLTHQLFTARSNVLLGAMRGTEVGPYLSGLLIGAEILGARGRFGAATSVTLVAEGQMAALYGQALQFFGISARMITPEQALVAGLAKIRHFL